MDMYEALSLAPLLAAFAFGSTHVSAALPPLDATYEAASARTSGDALTISTGVAERTLTWTGHGFVTTGLRNLSVGHDWVNRKPAVGADWSYPGVLPRDARATLLSLRAREADDEGFTCRHLAVCAEIAYPEQGLTLKMTVWAYPGAPGLRQRLWAKGGQPPNAATATPADAPAVSVIAGRAYANPQARGVRPDWEVTTLNDDKAVSLRLENIRTDTPYVIGLSWWDFGNGGRRQAVEVTSVDGETRKTVIGDTLLPGWLRDRRPAQSVTFDLPRETVADGTATIIIQRKNAVASANVSELWVYEFGAKNAPPEMDIDPERRRQLQAAAPAGARLVAYLDAGKKPARPAAAEGGAPDGPGGRVDYVPVDTSGMRVAAAGYYSDTQNRNTADTPVLRQANLPDAGVCDWANLIFVDNGAHGLTLVKESHKTVQTPGVDTGMFQFGSNGVENTGWSLTRAELSPDTYRWLWGSWVLVHGAGTDAREQAVKTFDRLRFPTDKARDMWMVMCTWGHSKVMDSKGNDGRTYAYEQQVLYEMDHVADLGIDMLLIDDGWQAIAPFDKAKYTQEHSGWRPHPGTYPTGDWRNVRAKADRLGLRLGLWAAYSIGDEDLIWNWQRLKQEQQKLDFANLRTHAAIDAMRNKARGFLRANGHSCIISWDTTEASPRYGYYLFREYGNVHFMNRKPEQPGNVLYVPWLCLRDFWQLSRYQNLNKWQLVIQNPDVVAKSSPGRNGKTYTSDAWKHGADYCVATALMGTPEFMAVTRYYSEDARKLLRPLIARYKSVRGDLWDSTVYPVGDEPSNASWTGFQAVGADGTSGYLTVFRELQNPDPETRMALRFLQPGTPLTLTDLRTGEERIATLDDECRVPFSIERAPGFLFLKYSRRDR